MKFASLAVPSLNLGDELQRIAADRFLPRIDFTVDRERMHEASDRPPTFYISNGWFMHQPDRFPPPPNLHPFYVSFHVTGPALLSEQGIDHLRRFAPIGCRDWPTVRLLREHGIPSYFSGCLTWTLRRAEVPRTEEVLLVDVPPKFGRFLPTDIRSRARTATHWCCIGTTDDYLVMPRWSLDGVSTRLRRRLDRIRRSGRRILRGDPTPADEEAGRLRRSLASDLVDRYSRASLVVTRRIHAAFPSVALGTPVVLLQPDKVFSPSRYDVGVPFVRPWRESEFERIDWHPSLPDVTPCRRFLEALCEEAVRIRSNPLRRVSIEEFYARSGFRSDGVR